MLNRALAMVNKQGIRTTAQYQFLDQQVMPQPAEAASADMQEPPAHLSKVGPVWGPNQVLEVGISTNPTANLAGEDRTDDRSIWQQQEPPVEDHVQPVGQHIGACADISAAAPDLYTFQTQTPIQVTMQEMFCTISPASRLHVSPVETQVTANDRHKAESIHGSGGDAKMLRKFS